jgi:hypothetical protein
VKRKAYAVAVVLLTPLAAAGFAMLGAGCAVLGMLRAALDLWGEDGRRV